MAPFTDYKNKLLRSDYYQVVEDYLPDQKKRNKIFGFILFSPSILFLVTLAILPFLYIFYISFHEVDLIAETGEEVFIGLENYVTMVLDPDFRNALWVGILFSFFTVVVQLIVGIGLALILNRKFPASNLIRTLVLLPYLIPTIAVVVMWQWLLHPQSGVVNFYAVSLGLLDEPMSFLGHVDFALPSLIVASSWKYVAFCTLFVLARLQTIDDSMYEQAAISGAGVYRQFRDITLPQLRSIILLLILLRGIFMFNKFGIVYMFTQGGPVDVTTHLPIYVYEATFNEFQFGYGSAGAIAMFLVLLAFATVYFWRYNPADEVAT